MEIFSKAAVPAEEKKTPAILITGGIHGDEYLGFEHQLPEWFLSSMDTQAELRDFFSSGGRVFVIPIQNPDGFIDDTRTNAFGRDLNREFPISKRETEPEVKAVTSWVARTIGKKKRSLALSMDYHCCTGALLYPTFLRGRGPAALPSPTPFLKVGAVLRDVIHKTVGGLFRVGTSLEILGYQATGTAKDYFSEHYRSLSLTFEGQPDARNALHAQKKLWAEILGKLNAGKL